MNELNKERRKVAEYLRREDIYKKYSQSAIGILSTLYETITGTEDFSFIDSRELSNKLAELIDRPTCHDFGGKEGTNGENYDFACSACGYLCDLAEPIYCPNCGAEIVDE